MHWAALCCKLSDVIWLCYILRTAVEMYGLKVSCNTVHNIYVTFFQNCLIIVLNFFRKLRMRFLSWSVLSVPKQVWTFSIIVHLEIHNIWTFHKSSHCLLGKNQRILWIYSLQNNALSHLFIFHNQSNWQNKRLIYIYIFIFFTIVWTDNYTLLFLNHQ